jgi:hypothetical protein
MAFKIKKTKKRDLLEVSDAERVKILMEAKTALRQHVVEAKLWKQLLEVDDLIINGEAIVRETDHLTGLVLGCKV